MHCLREAGAGGSNPLTPTKSKNEIIGSLTRQGEAIFSVLDAGWDVGPNRQVHKIARRFWAGSQSEPVPKEFTPQA